MFSSRKAIFSSLFNNVYFECYSRPAQHADLEEYLKKTKAGTNLAAFHLNKIFSDESWNFSKTWGIPAQDQIQTLADEIREDLKFVYNLSPVVNAEERLLKAMVKTIKNIEIVSVCLFYNAGTLLHYGATSRAMIGFRRTSDKVKTLKGILLRCEAWESTMV